MQHRTPAGARPERAPAGRAGARAFAVAGLGAAALLLAAAPQPRQEPGQELDTVRAALEQLVATRALLSKEEQDWALGRELLTERIAVVQREIESRRAATAQARGSSGDVDGKLAELEAENERLESASASLRAVVGELEARAKALLAKLPEPALERVRLLSQRIPADPDVTEESLSQRFLSVVGILNELNRFHSEVNAFSEVRTLPDGSNVEVTALYVGLSKGYYVTATGDAAGVSVVTDAGWSWEPDDAAAAEIARAIAIHANEDVAAFVRLPLRVQ